VLRSDAFLDAAGGLLTPQTLDALSAYAKTWPSDAVAVQQTRQEFMNLFRVPGAQYVAPYESVYRDTHDVNGQRVSGLLMGPSAVDVRKWYRLAALEISEEYGDLPDHVGLELQYMAHLCGKEAEFSASGNQAKLIRAGEMQRDFAAAHLVPWLPPLRDRIHEKSRLAYFRAVADLAVEFTRRDLATLEAVLGPSSAAPMPPCKPSRS
jgi:TorA maturation chaperone TorD